MLCQAQSKGDENHIRKEGYSNKLPVYYFSMIAYSESFLKHSRRRRLKAREIP